MTESQQGPGASDLGKDVIKIRKVTNWQPNFSASGQGEPTSGDDHVNRASWSDRTA